MTNTSVHRERDVHIHRLLVGKIAVPDHPETVLNPNGRRGFVIVDVMVTNSGFAVRGDETMWFGASKLIEIKDAPKQKPTIKPEGCRCYECDRCADERIANDKKSDPLKPALENMYDSFHGERS